MTDKKDCVLYISEEDYTKLENRVKELEKPINIRIFKNGDYEKIEVKLECNNLVLKDTSNKSNDGNSIEYKFENMCIQETSNNDQEETFTNKRELGDIIKYENGKEVILTNYPLMFKVVCYLYYFVAKTNITNMRYLIQYFTLEQYQRLQKLSENLSGERYELNSYGNEKTEETLHSLKSIMVNMLFPRLNLNQPLFPDRNIQLEPDKKSSPPPIIDKIKLPSERKVSSTIKFAGSKSNRKQNRNQNRKSNRNQNRKSNRKQNRKSNRK